MTYNLNHESLRTELRENGEAHNLSNAQVERILALSDSALDEALDAEITDAFAMAFDDIRNSAIAQLALDPLVNIIYLQGDDYEHAMDEANDNGGSTEAVVAHLAQWDTGNEIDEASEINGTTDLAELKGYQHQLHEVDHGGIHYWLSIDHGLSLAALYRRAVA